MLAALQLGGGVEPGPAQRRAAALAERVLAAETDTAWWARIAAAASLVHSISGTAATCRDLFLTAWRRAPDDEVLAGVLPYAYMALAHPDDLRDRERAAARLTEAARRLEDPVAAFEAAHLTFSVALQRADGAAARRAHRAMLGLTDRVGDAGRRWSLAYAEAALASLDGRLEEAEALAGVALEIGSGVAPQRAMGAYAGQLFELRRLQGRVAELADLILKLVDEQPEVPGWAAVGALACAQVDPDRSRETGVYAELSRSTPSRRASVTTSGSGRPTTLVSDPSMRSTSAPPAPWMPYAPALSSGSPVPTYQSSSASERRRNQTRVRASAASMSSPRRTATPVRTPCARPERRRSMARAWAASEGLPRITSSCTTAVSPPITSSSGAAGTALALAVASRRT